MAKLVSDFITDVKRRAYIPDNQEAFADADLIAFTNQELQETLWPELITLGEEHFVISQFVDLKDSDGNKNYPAGIVPMPERAFASSLRELKLVDKGQLALGYHVTQNIPYFPMNDEDLYYSTNYVPSLSSNSIGGYHFVNNGLRLMGEMRDLDETLEMRLFIQPPTVESSSTLDVLIQSINYDSSTGVTFTVDGEAGTDFTSDCADGSTCVFDIYRKSSGALILADVTMSRTDVGGNTTLVAGSLTAGDMVTLAAFQTGGFTGSGNSLPDQFAADLQIVPVKKYNYIPLPPSAVNILEIAVALRYFESQGDEEHMKNAERRLSRNWSRLGRIYDERNKGEPKKISNRRGLSSFTKPRWGYWGR